MKKLILLTTLIFIAIALFSRVIAAPTNITTYKMGDNIVIDWDETSAPGSKGYVAITDYELEYFDGQQWLSIQDPVTPETYFYFPHNYVKMSVEVQGLIRITTVYENGTKSTPKEATITIPPYFESLSISNSSIFTPEAPETLATKEQRDAQGLYTWPDGNMGFMKRNGQSISLSANGPKISRHVVETNELQTDLTIQNMKEPADYASGGPVYYDAATDTTLMFYHAESHSRSGSDFYSYLGLAKSTDGGASFQDLGTIIEPDIPEDSPNRTMAVEVGSGAYAIVNGYFYVYFKDVNESNASWYLTLARANVADVLQAAQNGQVVEWQKYNSESFSSTGIGGASTTILDDSTSPDPRWWDVTYVQVLGKYVMVYSATPDNKWNHYITTSTDGITWAAPERLYTESDDAEMVYLTIASSDYGTQKSIPGKEMYIYRTKSPTGGFNRWDDASLERVKVNINVPPYELKLTRMTTTVEEGAVGDAGTARYKLSTPTLNRTGAPLTVSVTYKGTAQNGIDYTGATATASIMPNRTFNLIKLPTIDDGLPESIESVRLVISNPSEGSFISRNAGTIEIIDSDSGQ